MQLVDTHCHLNYTSFHDDLEAVLQRSRSHGIGRILIPGTDLPSSQLAVDLCARHPGLFAAVGVHPNDANTWQPGTPEELRQLAANPAVVAIGEIGLDFYRDHAPRDLQIAIFSAQLELAGQLQKPVVIHSRAALDDVISILETWRADLEKTGSPLAAHPGVLHSYEGGLEQASFAVEMGFKIGIGGPVTYKNALDKQAVAQNLPLEALLLETDAPFLSPHPHRGQRNEPAWVSLVAEKVAAIRGLALEQVATQTTSNAQELFAWPY
ncbi:hypothetical protein ADN00_02115 [Ornatilinea apprima]|uniref:Hydrolase TatD n=1 Tax=Ornatilinea apprima TaxID=1134406 RepID=A0A0P6Y480_9CHLR|nr:TatD family hydrolase [Ornatilinea apprima]KPL79782.1 hypothetical protein ADN00_02115 [Ornatilinea apprima]